MDPITASIVAALATGVAGGAAKVGSKLIVDAYDALKAALKKKFGDDSDLADAVDKLEAEPDFEPNQTMLAGRVKQVKGVEDPGLMELVKKLAEALESTPEGKKAASKYNITAEKIGVAGDNAHVEGGIHFK